MEKENRLEYIDILNVLSCIAVIYLHSNGVFWSFEKATWWLGANVIESVFYFAVPIFFMISGVTLLDYNKKYTTEEYFKKRMYKTLIPFIFWSIIGIIFVYYRKEIGIEELSPVNIINSILNTRFNGGFYWYFIALYTIYLVIPILAVIPEEKRKNTFAYIIVSYIILNVFIPLVLTLFKIGVNWNTALAMPFGANFVIYLFIGYYIDRYEIEKKYRLLIYILGIIGLLLHIFGTAYLSFKDNAINGTFKGYLGLPCIMYSAAIFLLFKYIRMGNFKKNLYNVSAIFKKQTFGIYLVHYFVLMSITGYYNLDIKSIKVRLILAPIIFIISWICVKIIQSIPILKKILP